MKAKVNTFISSLVEEELQLRDVQKSSFEGEQRGSESSFEKALFSNKDPGRLPSHYGAEGGDMRRGRQFNASSTSTLSSFLNRMEDEEKAMPAAAARVPTFYKRQSAPQHLRCSGYINSDRTAEEAP